MDRCPVELLCDIISHACTDGGYTGRSLSLTSRFFYTISLPYQLQTLAIHSSQQLAGVIDLLSQRSPQLRRVRHLYTHVKPQHDMQTIPRTTTRLLPLLRLVAPSLQSLSICSVEYWEALLPVDLPSLTELTIYANTSARSFTTSLPAPRLEKLHVAFYNALPEDLVRTISFIAPKLTHLRLDGASLDRNNGNLFQAIGSLSSGPTSATLQAGISSILGVNDGVASRESRFPDTLKSFIIAQAAAFPVSIGVQARMSIGFSSRLERLGKEDTSGKLRVLKMTPYTHEERYQDVRACAVGMIKRDWLDRIQGGDGCWKPSHVRIRPKSV